MQHIAEDLLEAYAMQTLPEEDAEGVVSHLLICEVCQVRLDDAIDFIISITAAASEVRHHTRTRTA